jgi:hypothetical protein
MTNSFSSGDNGAANSANQAQGTTLSQPSGSDNSASTGQAGTASSGVDINTVVKRLNDSQAFIETLKSERAADRQALEEYKREIAALQAKVESTPKLDAILDEVSKRSSGRPDSINQDELVNKAAQAAVGQLERAKQEAVAKENLSQVSKALASKFGVEKVDSTVAELAAQAGMTFDDIFEMAKRSPKAVFKLLGVENAEASGRSGESSYGNSVNSVGLPGTQRQEAPTKNLMQARTEKERIDLFNKKMTEKLAKLQ